MATDGRLTSEYQVARSGGATGIATIVLGALVSLGGTLGDVWGADTRVGIAIGAVVSCAGVLLKMLTDLTYINSRTKVKTTDAQKNRTDDSGDS